MSEGSDISTLYREFADALTEVLAENAVGPARRGRLARARAAVKKHPNYSDAGYLHPGLVSGNGHRALIGDPG
jgi:hypothetical protein